MKYSRRQTILVLGTLSSVLLGFIGCTTVKEPFGSVPLPISTPVSKLSFAYVENTASNSISMFNVSSTGMWNHTSPSTIPIGNVAENLVVDPSGRFVYVPNSHDNTVSMFTINLADGLLVPMLPATVPTGAFPQFAAVDPKGRFAYTANTNDNTVSMFTIGSSGILVPTNPASVHAGKSPGQGPGGITVDPTGRFIYTSNYSSSVSMFAIDQASGVLTPIGPGEIPEGSFPFPATIDPGGRFAYVPDNDLNRVFILAIDQTTGALTQTNSLPVPVDQGPTSVGIDPLSRFAYVVNREAGTISEFNINPVNGSLTPMSVPLISNPGLPWQILVDPSGQLAYVSNEALNTVSIYTIGVDGGLSPYSSASTGSIPGGIGIAVKH